MHTHKEGTHHSTTLLTTPATISYIIQIVKIKWKWKKLHGTKNQDIMPYFLYEVANHVIHFDVVCKGILYRTSNHYAVEKPFMTI